MGWWSGLTPRPRRAWHAGTRSDADRMSVDYVYLHSTRDLTIVDQDIQVNSTLAVLD